MLNKNEIRIIKEFLIKNDAIKISIFGSTARNEENKNSDIDILVLFSTKKSLLDLVRIER